MMNIIKLITLSLSALVIGCSAVKIPETNLYKISAFSAKKITNKTRHITLLVTPPDAVAGYQTSQMLYTQKPFQIESFAKNAWTSPPAEMLQPLIVQSMQQAGIFYAVASGPFNEEADYRLDTQLLGLEQNFIKKPSVLQLSVKIVLTHISSDRIVASRIITQQVTCPMDTPYGGVLAANNAVKGFTAIAADFVAKHINHS